MQTVINLFWLGLAYASGLRALSFYRQEMQMRDSGESESRRHTIQYAWTARHVFASIAAVLAVHVAEGPFTLRDRLDHFLHPAAHIEGLVAGLSLLVALGALAYSLRSRNDFIKGSSFVCIAISFYRIAVANG